MNNTEDRPSYMPLSVTAMQIFQNKICEWQEDQFGFGTEQLQPTIAHLMEEVKELYDDPESLEEYADCMILLLGAMGRLGIDVVSIFELVNIKLAINQARSWSEPDENGVIRHLPQNKYLEKEGWERFERHAARVKSRMNRRIRASRAYHEMRKNGRL